MTSEFSELVDAYYEALYRFAYSLSRDPSLAADLTQQTFYIFAEKGDQLRDRSKAKSWLFTTLHREFLKQRRRAQRMAVVEDVEPFVDGGMAAVEDGPSRKLDGASVVAALGGLDEIYRAPLTLFYLQQVSYKEIAGILGIPIGTVMSRLSRGKDQLRQRLLSDEDCGGDNLVPFPGSSEAASPSPRPSSQRHV